MDVTVVAAAAGLRALAVARRNLGVREEPPGSNRTPFGEWFGENGVPWCAIFVSYCFAEGAGVTLGRGHPGAWRRGMSSVPLLEAWLRAITSASSSGRCRARGCARSRGTRPSATTRTAGR